MDFFFYSSCFTQLHLNSVSYSAFLFVSPFLPQHIRKPNLQVLMKIIMRSKIMARRKTRTSRLWYWYQVSSWAWTLRCWAPLFLMVNSIQNTDSSRGLTGLSWWILDSRMAFSLYLWMWIYRCENVECGLKFLYLHKSGNNKELSFILRAEILNRPLHRPAKQCTFCHWGTLVHNT